MCSTGSAREVLGLRISSFRDSGFGQVLDLFLVFAEGGEIKEVFGESKFVFEDFLGFHSAALAFNVLIKVGFHFEECWLLSSQLWSLAV